jgi:hypothetical protein
MLASGVVDCWRQYTSCQHLTDVGNRLNHALPQFIVEDHFAPSSRAMMIDGAAWHGLPCHFLQTEGLSTKLQIIVAPFTARTGLVFNRERLLSMELHNIGPPDQAQPSRPERHGAFDAHISSQLAGHFIYTLVQHVSLDSVDVFVKRLLQVDQSTLARTIGVML